MTTGLMDEAGDGIDLAVGALDEHIIPYVLDSTPDVLSMGRRCLTRLRLSLASLVIEALFCAPRYWQ